MNKRWIYSLLILIGAASYGLLSPFIKFAYRGGWSTAEVTGSQMTMGTLLIWLLVLFTPASWSNPFRGPWIRLSASGIFGMALTTLFINAALAELDASLSVILLFQFTWITIVMDSIHRKKWPSRLQVGAVLVILAGTVLAVNAFAIDFSQVSPAGFVYGLASAFTYSLFLFGTGQIKSPMHPLMKSAVMMTAALPAIYIVFPPTFIAAPGNGSIFLWGLLLGMLGQVIPTLCFNVGIPKVGSTLAALLGSVELPVASLGAFFLLSEEMASVQWIGILVILAGIIVSEARPKARLRKG